MVDKNRLDDPQVKTNLLFQVRFISYQVFYEGTINAQWWSFQAPLFYGFIIVCELLNSGTFLSARVSFQ